MLLLNVLLALAPVPWCSPLARAYTPPRLGGGGNCVRVRARARSPRVDLLLEEDVGLGLVGWFLAKSRAGLVLKAVGDSHHSAHAIGYSVIKIRYLATMFGGAMAGLGGAYLSLSYTPMWAENMTAGRGWIALALVVFATWRPGRLVAGAYMFGLISVMQLHAQGAGIHVPSQFMSMLPYLATVIVLVIISSDRAKIRLNAPACIGQAFRAAQ